jgi:hypothetical protein
LEAAQAPHDAAGYGDAGVEDLRGTCCMRLEYDVRKFNFDIASLRECNDTALIVQVQVRDELAQSSLDRLGVPKQVAGKPSGAISRANSQQQSKVRAACRADAFVNETTDIVDGEAVRRVAERTWIDTRSNEDGRRISLPVPAAGMGWPAGGPSTCPLQHATADRVRTGDRAAELF